MEKARETRAFWSAVLHGAGVYQITTCWSSPRTIGWPASQSNAAANAGMFDGAPIARKLAGACGSVVRRTFSSSSVKLRRHTVAQLAKKRWSRLKIGRASWRERVCQYV